MGSIDCRILLVVYEKFGQEQGELRWMINICDFCNTKNFVSFYIIIIKERLSHVNYLRVVI